MRCVAARNTDAGSRAALKGWKGIMENRFKSAGNVVISDDVVAKIASVAATDIEGVADVVSKAMNIKKFFNSSSAAKAVHVSTSGSGTVIDIYVRLKEGYKISALAERIQKNVKEQVQNMTGTVVTRVNVHVCEIDLKKPAPAEQK